VKRDIYAFNVLVQFCSRGSAGKLYVVPTMTVHFVIFTLNSLRSGLTWNIRCRDYNARCEHKNNCIFISIYLVEPWRQHRHGALRNKKPDPNVSDVSFRPYFTSTVWFNVSAYVRYFYVRNSSRDFRFGISMRQTCFAEVMRDRCCEKSRIVSR